ncbi:DNA-binding response OmpR family regulator [Pararhizobium capsulatum DSM 1112]|uniref:DNA-binding response OmpR family regulator n=1 Tax=Pararhizobium capsulatum DSM 1112 TaxID=1121113 RepID=A0ABU0BMU6_9HYPH|nr:response regulator [Pararhizobium capsulatum]MDQ0319238.1 DNA-binding response OmpR family regulator [Pararhizobium capsulatum DSM 1112]
MTTVQQVTIIMVEDDEGHARLIEKNIRRAGVTNEILPFLDGSSALTYFLGEDGTGARHEGRPLLLLLDLNLPDMTGISILERLRKSEHLKRMMVIVLTTTDDPSEIHRCYDLGANVYVAKPMQYEAFVNAIRQLGLFLSVVTVPEVA